MQGPTGIDAYAPPEIAARIEAVGVTKANLALIPLATLGVLAGVFIGFGGMLFTAVTTGVDPTGPVRLLGGAAFALGLILVVVGGAELFTGNALMVMAWTERRIGTGRLLRNWGVVLVANLAGALALVAAMWAAGLLAGPEGARAAAIARAKMDLSLPEAFVRGVLCNALVCLAVWLTMAARSVTDKIMAVIWPIAGFVALGFEHSVANFYLIPAGIAAGAEGSLGAVVGNLVPVTLGNVVGGAGGVALAYRLAYGRAKPG
ncbi:MAG: formate/nitrite transporter family protein [Gemmobacter sp.]